MSIATHLEARRLVQGDISRYALVDVGETACEAVAAMNVAQATCAVVMSSDMPVGIFSDHDVVQRIAGQTDAWSETVEHFTIPEPRVLSLAASVLDALNLMNERRLRHVLVLNQSGAVAGVVTDLLMIREIDGVLSSVHDQYEFSAEHGLLFVDFTGLSVSKPVTVRRRTPLSEAIHQMRMRSIGSVLVVDERESLVGILTEHDVRREIACRVEDLESVPVDSYMTGDPVSLNPRSVIAEGFAVMRAHGISHLPLVADSGRPVGLVSFRDLAEYLQASVAAVG